jgi:hypothetical protein
MSDTKILITDSVTKLGSQTNGRVLIAGSHGGIYAGHQAAVAGVRGVILHDASVGLDSAGIGALSFLDKVGLAAATISGDSATIGDGAAMAKTGIISFVNEAAARVGCATHQTALDAASCMLSATPANLSKLPDLNEARFVIEQRPAAPPIIGCDSVSLVIGEDLDAIVVTASHGELLSASPSWGSRPNVLGTIFNDAGRSTVTRLPDLDSRQIAAATVSASSARIGDARSTWQSGIISHINEWAAFRGAVIGMTTKEFAEQIIASK